jgi:hypothetical protein
MKRKLYYVVLAAEAIVCAALVVARAAFGGAFSAAMAFPFEQIGAGLRALSLSGEVGNAAAIAIYAALSLLPAAVLPFIGRRRKLFAEDWLLGLLSVSLFAVLYFMVNPGVIGTFTGGAAGQAVGKAVLGSVAYSIVCGYFILRALRMFFQSDARKLIQYMSVALGALGMLFVYMIFGACFSGLLDSVAALRAGNAGNENLLGASYVFLIIQALADALPYALDICVVAAALRLLTEFRADRYSPETVAATDRMSKLCTGALAATVLTSIGFNLLQLLFVKTLMIVNVSVNISIVSVAFVLAALMLTRFIEENKRLKDDNDMFI